MLAENDVIYAFKMLLNRMPEEEAIKSLCASQLKTIEELGKVILTSEEFRIKNSIITNDNAVRVPFNAKPMQVNHGLICLPSVSISFMNCVVFSFVSSIVQSF